MRGIKLQDKKDYISVSWNIKRPPLPASVVMPLAQSKEIQTIPLVEIGQQVLAGQKIGEPATTSSVFLHASISGEVTSIDVFPHPILGIAKAIEISSNGQDQKLQNIGIEREAWERLSREELHFYFRDLGLVNLDTEMTVLHIKAQGDYDTLIINASEPEPYVTADHALMMSHPLEVLKGAEILRKACGAKRVVILTEMNKLEAAETLKSKIYFLKWNHIEVRAVSFKFPFTQDNLLKSTLKKSEQNEKYCILNLATAFSAYEAIVLQKPLYERAVTIAGECVIEPKNLWVRMGTDFKTAIKACRGFLREPRKVLMGGPMKGIAQDNIAVPVLKGTQAILSLPYEVTKPEDPEVCIRCGYCNDACPVNLNAALIGLAVERNFFDFAFQNGVDRCIECGSCSYVCPSKRPMLELMRYALGKKEKKVPSFSPSAPLVEKMNLATV